MANEVEVFELAALRGDVPARPMPPIAKQVLTIGGAVSAGFNAGTLIVTIITTTACRVVFSTVAGVDPTGAGITFPLAANTAYDFAVIPGRKVIAVAA